MITPNIMPRRVKQYGTNQYQKLTVLLATGRAAIAWGESTYAVMVDSILMAVPRNEYTTALIRRFS